MSSVATGGDVPEQTETVGAKTAEMAEAAELAKNEKVVDTKEMADLNEFSEVDDMIIEIIDLSKLDVDAELDENVELDEMSGTDEVITDIIEISELDETVDMQDEKSELDETVDLQDEISELDKISDVDEIWKQVDNILLDENSVQAETAIMAKTAAVSGISRLVKTIQLDKTAEQIENSELVESSEQVDQCVVKDYGSSDSEADVNGGGGDGRGENAGGMNTENVGYLYTQSKLEKKTRKALFKLGLIPIPGVKKVTIRKKDNTQFIISNPEVFKNPTSDSYIVFGNWQTYDLNQMARSNAARMYRVPELPERIPIQYAEYDDEIDYQGVDTRDVDLICEQLQVDKLTAIDSLLRNNNDIVQSIMELTQP